MYVRVLFDSQFKNVWESLLCSLVCFSQWFIILAFVRVLLFCVCLYLLTLTEKSILRAFALWQVSTLCLCFSQYLAKKKKTNVKTTHKQNSFTIFITNSLFDFFSCVMYLLLFYKYLQVCCFVRLVVLLIEVRRSQCWRTIFCSHSKTVRSPNIWWQNFKWFYHLKGFFFTLLDFLKSHFKIESFFF